MLAQDAWRRLRLEHQQGLAIAGPPSYVLTAHPQDHGSAWPAIRRHARTVLPAALGWAAPLLSSVPEPVLCGHSQAAALHDWLESLPAGERVSISFEHRGAPTPTPRGQDPAGRIGLTEVCFAIAAEHGDRVRAAASARTTAASVLDED
jgi:hypothetical protein